MTKNPISITKEMSIRQATSIMLENNFQSLPVVDDDNKLVGIVTERELFKAIKLNIDSDCQVDEIMRKRVLCVDGDTKTDKIFNMGISRVPIVDKDEKLIGIITVSDMLKAYYKKSSYVTEELEAILKHTHNGILAVNKNGKIISINESALKIINKSESEVLEKKAEDIIHNFELKKVLETGESQLGEKCLINGLNVIVNKTPIIRNNQVVGAIATFQDITELENAIKELSNEKNLTRTLKTILENVYDGIVVVDEEGKIIMMNDSYAEFLNVNVKDVIGKHVTEVIQNTRLHIILETGEAEIGDIQEIGENKIVAMRIPIKENDKVIGAIGKIMFRDIQEVKSLAKKLTVIQNELDYYKDELKRVRQVKYSFENIPDNSYKMKETKKIAKIASKSNSTVLITGESGTGKELFAHSIHNASPRHLGPFIKMNCAAIPYELLESELFGYSEGAFTGAKRGGKIGKFQLAHQGTIFLDEIGDMPLEMQAKILRVLQEKEIEPVGSNTPISVDVRIIAATNRDLETLVNEGKFRKDLYYRLNVIRVDVPSLRERKEDLEELVNVLLKKHSKDLGKYIPGVSKESVDILKRHDWPGNVRELENVLERAINVADCGEVIKPMHLPVYLLKNKTSITSSRFSLKQAIENAEREIIIHCLKHTNGNRVKAAKLLNISRSTLYEKLDKYQIKDV